MADTNRGGYTQHHTGGTQWVGKGFKVLKADQSTITISGSTPQCAKWQTPIGEDTHSITQEGP